MSSLPVLSKVVKGRFFVFVYIVREKHVCIFYQTPQIDKSRVLDNVVSEWLFSEET